MKKADLVQEVSKKIGVKASVCDEVVSAFLEEIETTLKNGDEVKLFGFGKFVARKYKARKCYNPAKDKIINLPSSIQPAFIPGVSFRNRLK